MAQKQSDLTKTMSVLPARTFLMEGNNMLEIEGSILSPLHHPLWQEFQDKREIMPVPQGASRDSRVLSTLTSAGRFFCLVDGEPAWVQELCSPTSVSWVRPHAVIWDQRPAAFLSVAHQTQTQESKEMGMKCPPFQLSPVSIQQCFVRSRHRVGFNLSEINGIPQGSCDEKCMCV